MRRLLTSRGIAVLVLLASLTGSAVAQAGRSRGGSDGSVGTASVASVGGGGGNAVTPTAPPAIPEPTGALAFALGLGTVGFAARRRRSG
jgi:hypothetical protein